MDDVPQETGAAPTFLTGGGQFFCRLCGHTIRAGFDLAMGFPSPPGQFLCPGCGGRALDEYTLLLNLGVFRDTSSLCPCGTGIAVWDRGSRFCFRCGRGLPSASAEV